MVLQCNLSWKEGEKGVLFMPDLHSLLRGPYYYLILGVISLSVGVFSTCTGVTWARFGRVIYRAKQPKAFWEDVITCYLIGVCFIGYFLYKVYGL
jgi:uncharacterized protein (DUF486 family)